LRSFNPAKVPRGSNCGVDRTDAQSLLPGINGRFWREADIREIISQVPILLQESKI
jgi:hypothetical protein